MNVSTTKVDDLLAGARPILRPRVSDSDAVDTHALIAAFWRKRWLLAGASLLAGILTYLYVSTGTPTFTATAKMMLDVRKTQIVNVDEIVADIDPSEQTVNSEMAVLRSGHIIDSVIAQLTPAQLDMLDPALKPQPLLKRVIGSVKGLLLPASTTASDIDPVELRNAGIADTIRNNRRIFAEKDSYVMVIRVEAESPTLARDIANYTAKSYIELQLSNRRGSVAQATGWLEDRLVELAAEVEKSETELADFQTQALLTDGGTLENASQQLLELNTQLIAASGLRVEAEARLGQLTSVLSSGGVDAAARIVPTPTIQALRDRQLELQNEDTVWARSFGENQSRRVRVRQELAETVTVLRNEINLEIEARRSEAAVAYQREAGLRESITILEEQMARMNRNQLEFRQLEREADATRATYESLLSRVSEARAQRELQQPDTLFIERAIAPRSKSAPRPAIFAVMAVAVTFAGISSLIFFREIVPTTFRGIRELESETGLPVMATFPEEKVKSTRQLLLSIQKDPFSKYAERIRQLRTSLAVGHGSKKGQSVLIMSSAPGEGKSTTSLALAQMAALGGASTIVVDCDLRGPRVASSLDIADRLQPDFVDFIENRCSLADAIHHSEEFGFHVLAPSRPHRQAADELSVRWIKPMLRELTRAYDFVVIDAPALLAVPDAMTLVGEVDTRLYLVSFDETPRSAVQLGINKLSELGVNLSGLILNRVDPARSLDAKEEVYAYEN